MSTFSTTTAADLNSLGATSNLGDTYFETTNKRIVVWDGSAWILYNYDSTTAYQNRNMVTFDGTNDQMDTGASIITGTSPITLSCWINLTSSPVNYDQAVAIRGSTSGGTARMLGFFGGKAAFNSFASLVTSTTVLSTGTWYHLAATCTSGGAAKVYVNGVLEVSGTVTYNSVAAGNTLTVGRGGVSEYIPAKIDEVAVWDEVLSDGGVSVGSTATGDIATLYNSGSPSSTILIGSGPAGWWRMGDGTNDSGTNVDDMSNNGNHGTLSGGATITALTTGDSIYV